MMRLYFTAKKQIRFLFDLLANFGLRMRKGNWETLGYFLRVVGAMT